MMAGRPRSLVRVLPQVWTTHRKRAPRATLRTWQTLKVHDKYRTSPHQEHLCWWLLSNNLLSPAHVGVAMHGQGLMVFE